MMTRCSSGAASRRGGFSLLEVLIAMLILSVGAASVLALFAAGAATHRRSVDRTQAALIADRVFSEARAAYHYGATAEEVHAAVKAALPERFGDYGYDLLIFHPEGEDWAESELFARVTVRWRETGAERTESFHTIVLPSYRIGAARE